MKDKTNKISIRANAVLLPVLFVVLCAMVLSSVYAFNSIRYTNDRIYEPVTDSFEAAIVSCNVVKGDDGVYTVTNTGNVSVYLRIKVVSNWVNSNGSLHYIKPVVNVELNEDWFVAENGYQYYKYSLGIGEAVSLTVAHDENTDPGPVNTTLDINFIAEVIQSKPSDAVEDAWDVTVSGSSGVVDWGDLNVGVDGSYEWGDFNEFEGPGDGSGDTDDGFLEDNGTLDDIGNFSVGNVTPQNDYTDIIAPGVN